jgi:hypothetical protein
VVWRYRASKNQKKTKQFKTLRLLSLFRTVWWGRKVLFNEAKKFS